MFLFLEYQISFNILIAVCTASYVLLCYVAEFAYCSGISVNPFDH